VDTSRHYCPNQKCAYYGWLGLGNIVANGHPNSGQWRQLRCIVCGKTFLETAGTLFYRSRTPVETILRALAALAEGMAIRQVARVFQVDPNTVWEWLACPPP
jgi:transposase-like protein